MCKKGKENDISADGYKLQSAAADRFAEAAEKRHSIIGSILFIQNRFFSPAQHSAAEKSHGNLQNQKKNPEPDIIPVCPSCRMNQKSRTGTAGNGTEYLPLPHCQLFLPDQIRRHSCAYGIAAEMSHQKYRKRMISHMEQPVYRENDG